MQWQVQVCVEIARPYRLLNYYTNTELKHLGELFGIFVSNSVEIKLNYINWMKCSAVAGASLCRDTSWSWNS